MTFEAAYAAYLEANKAFTAAREAQHKALADRRSLEKRLKLAIAVEDFEEAARLKAMRESDVDKSQVDQAAKAMHAAYQQACDAYQAEFPRAFDSAREVGTVTRVVVINPRTHLGDSAVYLQPEATIQLNVDDVYFESEAWHVGEWAATHGFVVKHTTLSIHI